MHLEINIIKCKTGRNGVSSALSTMLTVGCTFLTCFLSYFVKIYWGFASLVSALVTGVLVLKFTSYYCAAPLSETETAMMKHWLMSGALAVVLEMILLFLGVVFRSSVGIFFSPLIIWHRPMFCTIPTLLHTYSSTFHFIIIFCKCGQWSFLCIHSHYPY